ncbi:phosphotransferase [Roseospirillum parvum]|uniref:Phosphotransferase enzyme family protein n=1 Tax=Roseospirillum parvum TaxID=83401 RepID=A0A1G8D1D9_9PROT|nr:phosphotransferase [Roseospirillum parvum]SDH51585.1 Phosphotransferase enzyme family protein [Roseospirillum parvum]
MAPLLPPPPDPIRQAMRRVPLLAPLADQPAGVGWRRLVGGDLGLIEVGGTRVALRLPEGTPVPEAHGEEIDNWTAAAGRGLAPPLLFADPADGLVVFAWPEGSPATPRALAEPQVAGRVGRLLGRLHRGAAFRHRFTVWDRLARWRPVLEAWDTDSLGRIDHLAAEVEALRPLLRATAPPETPCHNDLTPRRLVIGPRRVQLIDWALSGMGDPHLDLAELIAQAELPQPAQAALLAAWAEAAGAAPPEARVTCLKPVIALWWALRHAERLDQALRAGDLDNAQRHRELCRDQVDALAGRLDDPALIEARARLTSPPESA